MGVFGPNMGWSRSFNEFSPYMWRFPSGDSTYSVFFTEKKEENKTINGKLNVNDDPLWRPLMGGSERKKNKFKLKIAKKKL